MEPHVSKRTSEKDAYFTIWWSPLVPLTKRIVVGRVPSLPGVFEIYCSDGGRTPQLVGQSRAYYGGLRNTFRGLIDPMHPYPLNGEPLDLTLPHYARYAITPSPDDMSDILFFFASRIGREDECDASGRYDTIYVREEVLGPNGRPR